MSVKIGDELLNYEKSKVAAVSVYTPTSGATQDLIIYADGSGMPEENTALLASFLNDNPRTIMLLNGSINARQVSYNSNFSKAVDEYANSIGAPLNLNIIGFSGGTTDSIRFACKQAQIINENGSRRCNKIIVDVIDTGYGYMNTGGLTDNDYTALANNNGKVLFHIHDTSAGDWGNQRTEASNIKTMKKTKVVADLVRNKVPTYLIETHFNEAGFPAGYGNPHGHGSTNQTTMKYFIPLLYGKQEAGIDRYFDIEVPIVSENGGIDGWRRIGTSEMAGIFSDVYVQTFKDTYSDINNISASDNTVASNINAVFNGMTAINKKITENDSLYVLSTDPYEDNICTIPKNLSNGVESLFGISRNLMISLSTDTEAVCSIAQYLYNMDKDLCDASSSLGGTLDKLYKTNEFAAFKDEIKSINLDLDKIDISMFSTTNITGKTGKVSTNDLIKTSTSLLSSLDKEINDANSTKLEINNFINNMGINNLIGEIWNNAASSLEDYACLMDLRGEAANTLIEAIKVSTAFLIDYIGEDGELDDSKIPEVETKIASLKQEIQDLTNKINATHEECSESSDGRRKCETVHDYDSGSISQFKAIIEANNESIKTLEILLNKLNGLAEAMNKAQKIIEQALSSIKTNYATAVNNKANIKNFSYDTDGIKYSEILGSTFNKSDYLSKYDNYASTITVNNTDTTSALTNLTTPANTDTSIGGTTAYNENPYGNGGSSSYSESSYGNRGSSSDNTSNQGTQIKEENNEEALKLQKEELDKKELELNEREESLKKTESTKESNSNQEKEVNETYNYYKNDGNSKSSKVKTTTLENKEKEVSITENEVGEKVCPPGYELEQTEPTVEPIVEPIEEPIIEQIDESIIEPIIEKENIAPIIEIEPEPVQDIAPEVNVEKSSSNGLKTVGIIAGAGLAVGAAALGAYEYKKANENETNTEEDIYE